jgi:hypothetical protein
MTLLWMTLLWMKLLVVSCCFSVFLLTAAAIVAATAYNGRRSRPQRRSRACVIHVADPNRRMLAIALAPLRSGMTGMSVADILGFSQ